MLLTRYYFTTCLLLFATIFSVWLVWHTHKHRPQKPLQGHYPNMFVKDMRATRLGDDGIPLYQIISPSVLYYPDNNSVDFTTPVMRVFNPPQNPWEIRSLFAEAINDFEKVTLKGNVQFHQLPSKANSDNHMATDQLIIYPKRKFAQTDEPVIFWQPGSTMTGVGMESDMNAGWVRLLNKVHGIYVPEK